jgi:hypothetical protein
LALGNWASRSPSFPQGAEMGPDSLVLALKSTFQPEKADGLEATYELRLGELPFRISIKEGEFAAARGEADAADAVIQSDAGTIASVVFGGNPLGKALQASEITVDGSRRAANSLFRSLT